jgi:hypothetical protein
LTSHLTVDQLFLIYWGIFIPAPVGWRPITDAVRDIAEDSDPRFRQMDMILSFKGSAMDALIMVTEP